jgi:hypothetical protein
MKIYAEEEAGNDTETINGRANMGHAADVWGFEENMICELQCDNKQMAWDYTMLPFLCVCVFCCYVCFYKVHDWFMIIKLNINSDFICLVSLICVVFYGWVNFISRNAEITMSNNMIGVWTPVLYFICEFPIACHLFHSHTLS